MAAYPRFTELIALGLGPGVDFGIARDTVLSIGAVCPKLRRVYHKGASLLFSLFSCLFIYFYLIIF